MVINQSGDDNELYLNATNTSSKGGNAGLSIAQQGPNTGIQVEQRGTLPGILIDQVGNASGLEIVTQKSNSSDALSVTQLGSGYAANLTGNVNVTGNVAPAQNVWYLTLTTGEAETTSNRQHL